MHSNYDPAGTEPDTHPVSPLSTTHSRSSHKRHSSVTSNSPKLHSHAPEIAFDNGHPNQKTLTHSRYRIFGRWKWELTSLGLALGILIAIAVILKEFNEQSVPDWGFAINLSTLLALLATIFRSAIVAIMAQIISQTKWAGFMTGTAPRPLQHLQDFDSASRNALGAAALIPKVLRHNPLASMAAVVTIASLAVGPMVQQSIRTAECAFPTAVNRTGASIPYARFVPRTRGYNRYGSSGQGILDYQTTDAIRMSLTRPAAIEQQVDSSLECPTGNCTFPVGDPIEDEGNVEYTGEPFASYTTVGLCSRCVDISSLIKTTIERSPGVYSTNNTLPNGLFLSSQAGVTHAITANATIPGSNYDSPAEGRAFRHVDWAGDLVPPEAAFSFSNLTILTRSNATCKEVFRPDGTLEYCPPTLVAVICPIYPCMRTYKTTVINNKVHETKIGSTPLLPAVVAGNWVPNQNSSDAPINTSGRFEVPFIAKRDASYPYVGIKSPCRSKDGTQVYTRQNMSLAQNTTFLHIYDKLQPNGRYNTTSVIAPPECLYMHGAAFGEAISDELQEILGGDCSVGPRSEDGMPGCRTLSGGLDGWLHSLHHSGSATVESIQGFTESFSQAMTNFYRREIGSGDYDPSEIPRMDLAPGMIFGTVWKTNIRTSIQWGWLVLPASLAFLTLVLLAWTVIRSWAHRYDEPVWKDNVLPAMLYRERFETTEGHVVGPMTGNHGAQGVTVSQEQGGQGQGARLAETSEMERMAKNMLVSFRLSERDTAGVASMEQRDVSSGRDGNRLVQRRPRRLSLDSLLAPGR